MPDERQIAAHWQCDSDGYSDRQKQRFQHPKAKKTHLKKSSQFGWIHSLSHGCLETEILVFNYLIYFLTNVGILYLYFLEIFM